MFPQSDCARSLVLEQSQRPHSSSELPCGRILRRPKPQA